MTVQTIQLGMGWFTEESGGLNRYYAELVRHLPKVGIGVSGLVAGSGDVSIGSSGLVRAFAPLDSSLSTRLRGARTRVREELSRDPSGLMVAHFALYAMPCLDMLRASPLVVHFHGPWAAESRAEGASAPATRVKHWVEQAVYRRATRLVVLSRAFGRVLQRDYGVDPERIDVVPGGVDVKRFAPHGSRDEARRTLGWPTDRPIVLVVRRLVRRMGLENLIASMTEVKTRVPDALTIIAGNGPIAGELREKVASAHLEDHVRFAGFLPDAQLPLAYQAANVSIVPSAALEGFGLTVAESLAAGTPVMVTAVGGLPETIEAFAPQCIIGESTPTAIAAGLVAALQGELPLPNAADCVRYARERFAWSAVARQVGEVYAGARR